MFNKFNSRQRRITIRTKLLASLLLASTIMVIYTAVYSYRLATNRVKDISMRLSERTTQSAGKALENHLNSLYELSNLFLQLDGLSELAGSENISVKYAEVNDRFITLQASSSADVSYDFVCAFLENGYTIQTHSNVTLPFSDYESCVDYFVRSGYLSQNESYSSGQWALCSNPNTGRSILTYYRFIYEEITMRKLGIVIFGLYEENLQQVFTSYASNSYLLDSSGVLLTSTTKYRVGATHPDSTVIENNLNKASTSVSTTSYTDSSGKERIISVYPLWRMRAFLIVPFEFYETIQHQEMMEYVYAMIPMAIIAFILSFLLAIVLSRGVSSSIISLVRFTQKVDRAGIDCRYTPTSNDEIAELGFKINHMLDLIQNSTQQREQDLIANQSLELQLIQQQINPHLLYNTLDSILWVLQEGRTNDALRLVSALSEFFKISLSRGKEIIPLSDELQLIHHYLTIQYLARQQNIAFHTNIPENLLHLPIIKLTIQPLIENSILHGFSGYRNDGEISINAYSKEESIYIEIQDNGIGMTEDELICVRNALAQPSRPEEFHHFGLYNINQRIRKTYGAKYGLYVDSEISEYTKVTMILPQNAHMKPEA